jgi:hypothetical protein
MQAPKELAKPVATVRAAPFLSLEAPAGGDDGVPVELAVAPCALGAGELAEGGGGVDVDDAGAGDDALGAGGDDDAGGGVLGVLVGAEPAGGSSAGGDAVVGALVGGAGDDDGGGVVELTGGGDAGDAGGGAVLGAGAVPLLRVARTMTMSFSLARQLASTPLMKKSGPERASVTTVSPSSNFFTYDDVLQAL